MNHTLMKIWGSKKNRLFLFSFSWWIGASFGIYILHIEYSFLYFLPRPRWDLVQLGNWRFTRIFTSFLFGFDPDWIIFSALLHLPVWPSFSVKVGRFAKIKFCIIPSSKLRFRFFDFSNFCDFYFCCISWQFPKENGGCYHGGSK